MARVRHRLRLFVAAWLLFQAASLSALVPRDCCSAHRTAAKACHEASATTHCPVQAAAKPPCPAHGGNPPADESRCRMSGTCSGPIAALFTLLSNHGILSNPPSVFRAADAHVLSVVESENLVSKLLPPESPPPRA